MTRSIIAYMTFKEALYGKVLWLALFFAGLLVTFTYLLSRFIHTDDMNTIYKLLVDGGLTIYSLGLFMIAIFFSFQSASSDKKNQTLLLSLAMPIRRRDYLFGKFIGVALILAVVALLFYSVLGITLQLFLQHEAELVGRAMISGWLPKLTQACLGTYLAAVLQGLWTLGLSLLLDTEFLMIFLAFCIWGLGSLSQDWVHLAEHLPGWQSFVPLLLFHVLPDYASLNYLSETAYQIQLPWSELGIHFVYALAYAMVLWTLLSLALDRKDIF